MKEFIFPQNIFCVKLGCVCDSHTAENGVYWPLQKGKGLDKVEAEPDCSPRSGPRTLHPQTIYSWAFHEVTSTNDSIS